MRNDIGWFASVVDGVDFFSSFFLLFFGVFMFLWQAKMPCILKELLIAYSVQLRENEKQLRT